MSARGAARLLWPLAGTAWVALIGFLTVLLGFHTNAATRAAQARTTWPPDTALARTVGLPTLVVAIHPRCPCSRTMLEELNVVLTRFAGRVTAHAIFLRGPESDTSWRDADARRRATELPGLHVVEDSADASELRRFNLDVSGQVVLYDANGHLRFNGGITRGRDHPGPNDGRARVEALLSGEPGAAGTHPVYGCPLVDPVVGAERYQAAIPVPLTHRPALSAWTARACAACHAAGSRGPAQ